VFPQSISLFFIHATPTRLPLSSLIQAKSATLLTGMEGVGCGLTPLFW
jgi:hypothetical protein